MRKNKWNAYRTLIAALIIGLWSSCVVEPELPGSAYIEASFGLKSPAAMEGRIAIEEAYLKLDRMEGVGSLGGQNNTNVNHSVPAEEPPYRLSQSDSVQVSFAVTANAYDLFDLHLYLFQDNYNLVFNGQQVDVEEPPVDEPDSGNDGGEPDGDAVNENPNEDHGGQGNEDTDHDQGQEENEGDGHDSDDDNNDDGHAGGDEEDAEDDQEDHGSDEDDQEDHGSEDDREDDESEEDDRGDDESEEDDQGDDGSEENDEGDNQADKGDQGDKDKDKDEDKGKGKGKNKNKKGHKNEDHHKDHGGNDHHGDKHDNGDDDDDSDEDDDDGRRSGSENNQTVDLDHFFQNAKPAMVVFGRYENNGKLIKLIFVATGVEKLTLHARQNDSNKIILAEKNKARITLDPERWFQPLTTGDIESGETQIYQQQTVLFIHPEHNTELYEALISGIEESADLTFSFTSGEER